MKTSMTKDGQGVVSRTGCRSEGLTKNAWAAQGILDICDMVNLAEDDVSSVVLRSLKHVEQTAMEDSK